MGIELMFSRSRAECSSTRLKGRKPSVCSLPALYALMVRVFQLDTLLGHMIVERVLRSKTYGSGAENRTLSEGVMDVSLCEYLSQTPMLPLHYSPETSDSRPSRLWRVYAKRKSGIQESNLQIPALQAGALPLGQSRR